MFDDREVAGVLDWNMVSLAGPESDLAWWAIMHLLQTASVGVAHLEGFGSPTRDDRDVGEPRRSAR
jgi:aminoglycoside phosphotransferase (APT) family kinase protein